MADPIKIADKNKDFFQLVYEVVKLIPHGRVTSYGAIAGYLGSKRGARMVGWAMNNCLKHKSDLPAHRVVNRNGLLSGKSHFATMDTMQDRLEAEGIKIKENQILEFDQHFWNPMKEISF
jgi:methylated-DNA-protein-cysteine methyltransferase related protein